MRPWVSHLLVEDFPKLTSYVEIFRKLLSDDSRSSCLTSLGSLAIRQHGERYRYHCGHSRWTHSIENRLVPYG